MVDVPPTHATTGVCFQRHGSKKSSLLSRRLLRNRCSSVVVSRTYPCSLLARFRFLRFVVVCVPSIQELTWGQFINQRQEEPAAPNKKLRGGAEPASKPAAGFDAFDDDDVSFLFFFHLVGSFFALFFVFLLGERTRPMNDKRRDSCLQNRPPLFAFMEQLKGLNFGPPVVRTLWGAGTARRGAASAATYIKASKRLINSSFPLSSPWFFALLCRDCSATLRLP